MVRDEVGRVDVVVLPGVGGRGREVEFVEEGGEVADLRRRGRRGVGRGSFGCEFPRADLEEADFRRGEFEGPDFGVFAVGEE